VNHRTTLLSTAVGLSLACASLTATAGEFRTVKQPIPGQYIVVLKDTAASLASERSKLSRVSVVSRDIATKNRTQLVRSYNNVLRGFVARADDKGLARLLADPRVAYVQEDGVVSIAASQSNATWGIDRIDQRNMPLNQTYTYDTTASGVHAYIIDTGVLLNHAQFSGRMGNGYDAVSNGGNANDCNGHGTHVAGTVGGTTYGVAKEVKIHPVRVLGCNGSGSNSGVIAGMDWVAENHVKPAVVNMSLGGSADQATDDAVNRLHNAGVTVVVAAGNNSGNACSYSPARAANAITVGSTTNTDARSSFSNFGSCLDIEHPLRLAHQQHCHQHHQRHLDGVAARGRRGRAVPRQQPERHPGAGPQRHRRQCHVGQGHRCRFGFAEQAAVLDLRWWREPAAAG
jgi:serine protease